MWNHENVLWFLAGVGSAATLTQFAAWRRKQPAQLGTADLNCYSRAQLVALPGLDDDLAERILDNRPYRSNFDLLNRLIIPESVHSQARSQVFVEPAVAHRAIQIAME
jgi:DNA uptake protein ComE-like DNA-binding protein